MDRTTMDTALEDVLKEDIITGLFSEGNAVKVYGKLAGIPCIGKTYFVNWGEIEKANQYARSQIMQKYGDEVFGSSAQKKHQQSNQTISNTGFGDVVKESSEMGPLIDCSVDFLMDLPEKKKVLKEAKGTYDNFLVAVNNLQQYIQEKIADEDWKAAHDKGGTIKKINDAVRAFSRSEGPEGEENQRSFKAIYDIFETEPWKGEVQGKDSKMKKLGEAIIKNWKDWGGNAPAGFGSGPMQPNAKKSSSAGKETDGWHWEHAYRIDIKTNFDDNWYKRKFKSGLLNAAIMGLKTMAMARTSKGGETEMTGHKYTADEMLPQDKRKLDGIQWKMTNKVARDYIMLLLGWSRSKEKFIDEKTEEPRPKQETLAVDEKFGKEMANKALSSRGLFGRLKQKLFSGGQSNNVVSLSFQMADPEDGWKLVDEKTGEEVSTGAEEEAGSEGKDGEGGESAATSASSSGKSGSSSASGKNGKESGKEDGAVDKTLLQRVKNIEDKMTDNKLWGNNKPPSGTEKNNKDIKKFASESGDPFEGVFDDQDKMRLVAEVCGGTRTVDELVEHLIVG